MPGTVVVLFVVVRFGSGRRGCQTRRMARVGMWRCLLAAVLFWASAPAASTLAGEVPALVLAGLLYLGAGARRAAGCVPMAPNSRCDSS